MQPGRGGIKRILMWTLEPLNLIVDAPASGRWGEGVKEIEEGDETFWKASGRKFEEEVYPEFRGPGV
jgi:hypothetical protein